jgi:hypothetical protein
MREILKSIIFSVEHNEQTPSVSIVRSCTIECTITKERFECWQKTEQKLNTVEDAVEIADLALNSQYIQCLVQWDSPRGFCWVEIRGRAILYTLTFSLPFMTKIHQAAIELAYDNKFAVSRSSCSFAPKMRHLPRETTWKSTRTGEEFYSLGGLHTFLDGIVHSKNKK